MSRKGKLILFCGKMGAGKTTLSKTIASKKDAVLISEDEWLSSHYPALISSFEDYIKYSQLIKPFVKDLIQSILCAGVTVVMDFPANTIKQRKWLLGLSQEVGAEHELFFLNMSDEQCLTQMAKRRTEQPERDQFDTEDVFYEVTRYFEPPSTDEGLCITEERQE